MFWKNGLSKRTAYDYAYALEFICNYMDWNGSIACNTVAKHIDWVQCDYSLFHAEVKDMI